MLDVHPALGGLALVILAWFIHRATRPCNCCTHRGHTPEDFK